MSINESLNKNPCDLAVELWRVIVADRRRHPLAWWLGWF
jgi:hypothetical protein